MAEKGWTVKWSDTRKHIVYQDKDGHKIRDSNIEKTFAMPAGKEALTLEFERKAEQRKEEARELEQYYADVEAAISRANTVIKGNGADGRLERGEAEIPVTGSDDFRTYIAALNTDLEDAGTAVDHSRSQNRDIRSSGHKQVASGKQPGSR